MQHRLGPIDRIEPPRHLRTAAIFAGLGTFLLGAIVLGSALAVEQPGRIQTYVGPMLLLLGVSLIGGGFVMRRSDHWLDPELTFEGGRRYFVAGTALVSVVLAGAVALFG
jgi:hypothetical protein